jgi:hypothetical protein
MIRSILHKLLLLLASTGLVSCGGGSGGFLAGGGISGTGIGTITAFGSVIINDVREFQIDANTTIIWDGNVLTEQQLMDRGIGAVARVDVSGANDGLTSGTAVTIYVGNLAKGPVTGTGPLQVLGQTVVFDSNVVTVVDDVPAPGFDPGTLQVGDIVEVSGFADDANVIQATLLEHKKITVTPDWKLAGKVTATAPGEFNIGTQRVVLNGVMARNCAGSEPAVGELVDIKATPDPDFNTGPAPNDATLDTVTDVECETPGLGVPAGTAGSVIEAGIEGIVNSLACTGGDFEVGGQCIDNTSVPVTYEGGAVEDIVLGAKLEAEGDLDTVTGVLIADRIRFRENRVRIEAPVNVPAGGVGSAFTILDVVTVNTTPLTEDNDDLINMPASSGNRQVEVRGYVDSSGTVFATEIRDRGPGDPFDVRLRGPTSDTCDPSILDTELDILGVMVDTDSGAFPVTYINETVEPPVVLADNAAFCALVSIGSSVEVEKGIFIGGAPPRIIDAEQYSIEDL